jgi:hypothetical protein
MPLVGQSSLSTRTMDHWRITSSKSARGLAVERQGCACGGDLAAATTVIAQPPCWKRNAAILRKGQPYPPQLPSLPAGVSVAIRWAISLAIRVRGKHRLAEIEAIRARTMTHSLMQCPRQPL